MVTSLLQVSKLLTDTFIAQRGDNSDVVLWDFHSKRAIFRLSEHDHGISCLAFSQDDKLLISAGIQLDGKLFIWNTANGYIVSSLQVVPKIFSDGITAISWGGYEGSNYQFAISGSKKLTLWSLDPFQGGCNYDSI